MDVSRRTVMIGGTLFSLAGPVRLGAQAEESAKTLFVVLDAVDKALSPELAEQVFNTFFAKGVPITAILPCTPERHALITLFKEISARERGLFEVALAVDQPEDSERYFQLRAALDLRDCVRGDASDSGYKNGLAPIVSVLDRGQKPGLNPYALRAGGFRIQMRPALGEAGEIISADSRFEALDWGLARQSGGALALIEDDPAQAMATPQGPESVQTLYLSFRNAAGLAPEALLAHCAAWAEQLQATTQAGNSFLTRPIDYLLQGNPGASKYVGLVLDFIDQPGPDSQIQAFANGLDWAGIPYTVLLPSGAAPTAESCVLAKSSDASGLHCVALPGGAPAPHTEIVLETNDDPYFWSGPRRDGRYHAALRTSGADDFALLMEEDPLTDTILLIRTEDVATPIQQSALIGAFEQVRSDGKAHFYSVHGYVEQTLAPDPVLERFWSTARRQLSDPPVELQIGEEERATLLQDARLAWRFIERYSDSQTGICGGTVKTGATSIVNHWVTLWDIASQFHGIISAHSLMLIPQEEAHERVERILAHLPAASIGGLTLPPALFRSDIPSDHRADFDSCDTGRFLIALDKLVQIGLVDRARAEAVLAQWDIAATVKNQRPFNYSNGIWRDVTDSHCSHYTRHGYFAWGMPMVSAYTPILDAESGDQKIRLLYKAAFIGHFGTEPLLLEGLELGFSPEARYLSEVLFDAQLTWFEETGDYKSVSEAALDFPPWFSYQGLRVDRKGQEAWVISTLGNDPAYQTPDFYARADVLSSKASFLWAAQYPHPYTSHLLEIIRKTARIEDHGFSIGVFARTQKAMQGYSDINTNGVILTAISHMMRQA